MKPKIIREGNNGIIHTDVGVYSFSCATTREMDVYDMLNNALGGSSAWDADPVVVNGKELVPYGSNNNLPIDIRNIMDDNNLAPGILEREKGLLYGMGPQLYENSFEGGDVVRKYADDPKIWEFLNSFNLRMFVESAIVDYKHLKGFFVKRYRNLGYRIGRKPVISKLEVVPACDARLEWVNTRRLEDVKTIYWGDFNNNCMKGMAAYPVYNHYDPFKHDVCMSYHNSYSFCRNFYPVPGFFGALNWIKRSSDIPQILKYLTDNMLALAFHIHSPAGYWDKKKEALEKANPDKDDNAIDALLETLKDTVFGDIAKVLSGKKNTGKFIETVDFWDEDAGQVVSWKIEAIDHKIKDFVEAQIKISEKADSATTSGIGLHPALSNIMVAGKLSSGSEMLYALKLYLASDTSIPEEVIFEPINQAIQVNFPGTKKKLGFYHNIVMKEENVSPSERVVNNQ